MSEQDLINKIQILFSKAGHRIFRQNVGTGWAGKHQRIRQGIYINNPRPLRAGLCTGSSDLIGWRTITITPEMVGTTIAQFTAIEVKYGKTKTTPEQLDFIAAVKLAGGYADIVWHESEVEV